jgi:hypothetical protein
MNELNPYEFFFWIVIAVMCFLAFGLWLHKKLAKPESQKRIEKTNREAEELIRQARRKLENRERLDTKWGDL